MTKDEQSAGSNSLVGGVRVATILLGYCLSLPVIMVGAQLGGKLGPAEAGRTFLAGCFILALVGSLTGYIGARSRLTTYAIIQFPFGKAGAKIVNGLIGITIIGWFGVTLSLFAQAIGAGAEQILDRNVDRVTIILPGAMMMALTALWGFRALAGLSRVTVPAMGLFLLWAAGLALHTTAPIVSRPIRPDDAISLVVGIYIVGASLLPDVTRFARTARGAILGVAGAIGLALPLIMMAAMLPAVATGRSNMIGMFVGIGAGVPALVLVIAAAWTSNASNLYSCSLTFASILPRVSPRIIVVAAGGAGACLALLDPAELFVGFLSLLSVAIPPVSGIYIADFFVRHRQPYVLTDLDAERPINPAAFAAWGSGIAAGLFIRGDGPGFLSIAAVNSIVVAFLLYLVFVVIGRRARSLQAR